MIRKLIDCLHEGLGTGTVLMVSAMVEVESVQVEEVGIVQGPRFILDLGN